MIAHWQQVYGLPRQQAYAGIESLRQHNVVSRVSRSSIWRPHKEDPGTQQNTRNQNEQIPGTRLSTALLTKWTEMFVPLAIGVI